jgi:hypothetical protein
MRWVAFVVLAGCTDLGGFAGRWSGPSLQPPVRTGIAPDAHAELTISGVDRTHLDGTLALLKPPSAPTPAPLRPLTAASADLLGELSLPDSPLRSYLTAVTLPDGDALAIVSLYDDRVDLRLVRADTLFAVFRLARR